MGLDEKTGYLSSFQVLVPPRNFWIRPCNVLVLFFFVVSIFVNGIVTVHQTEFLAKFSDNTLHGSMLAALEP